MGTILTTIRWLSIFTGALSLFYLGNAWFEFGLGVVFTRIYAWYAGILHPVVELLTPVARWIVALLGWSLPVWWKDVTIVYLMIGGATTRAEPNDLKHEPTDASGTFLLGRYVPRQKPPLAVLPLIFLAWPILVLFDSFRIWFSVRYALRPGAPQPIFRYGYLATTAAEFFRILLGALIFAGLNAGLG